VPEALRHERLIARHERFGKAPRDARDWALGPDEANARLVAATRDRADVVVRPG
jgi:pantothenate kinase